MDKYAKLVSTGVMDRKMSIKNNAVIIAIGRAVLMIGATEANAQNETSARSTQQQA